jgi:hypothetical protein
MGKRGPKPRSDYERFIRGNPGHVVGLTYPNPPAIAPEFTRIDSESPLGFLERAARSGRDRAAKSSPNRAKRAPKQA